jgi:hypothetical protein
MKLIFDEYKFAEKILKNGFVNFSSQKELNILAKYYKYNGLENSEIKNNLFIFCCKFIPEYNNDIYEYRLDNAIEYSEKYSLLLGREIYITKNELEKIKKVNDYKTEYILFLMLAYCRYNRISKNITNKNYFIYENFSTFLNWGKIFLNKVEKEKVKQFLCENGYVNPTKGKLSKKAEKETYELLYFDESSEKEIIITDMDNAISFYPHYCLDCGRKINKVSYKKHLCDECYQNKRKEENANQTRKYMRNKRKK